MNNNPDIPNSGSILTVKDLLNYLRNDSDPHLYSLMIELLGLENPTQFQQNLLFRFQQSVFLELDHIPKYATAAQKYILLKQYLISEGGILLILIREIVDAGLRQQIRKQPFSSADEDMAYRSTSDSVAVLASEVEGSFAEIRTAIGIGNATIRKLVLSARKQAKNALDHEIDSRGPIDFEEP